MSGQNSITIDIRKYANNMANDENAKSAPYYDRHRVIELTCPHCRGMLSFSINERTYSKFYCSCGEWRRMINWDLRSTATSEVWEYEPITAD